MKAFPRPNTIHPDDLGMDLRDYFAAKAMQALIGLCYKEFDVNENKQEIAENAYELANSMMKERK
jgi:hypothetical protein